MRCKHCNKRLSVARMLTGDFSFCCAEHQELFANSEATEALERLRSSFENLAPKKPLPRKNPAGGGEPVLAEGRAGSPAEGWEYPVEEQSASPTEDAGESTIAETTGEGPPESTLIRAHLTPRDLVDESLLTSDAAEPIPGAVPPPIGPAVSDATRQPLDLAPDLSPALALPERAPAANVPVPSQAMWAVVPSGYPPVILSTSAKFVLDLHVREPKPLAVSQADTRLAVPCSQLEVPKISSLEPRPPILPRADERSISQPGLVPATELHVDALDSQLGFQAELPTLTGSLAPKAGFTGIVPTPQCESRWSLLSLQPLSPLQNTPFAPKQLASTPAIPILVEMAPRCEVSKDEVGRMSDRTLGQATFSDVGTTSLDIQPGPGHAGSWVRFADTGLELPRRGLTPASTSIGLTRDMSTAPIDLEIATSCPPALEIESSIAGTLPYLLAPQTLSVLAPTMHLSAVTLPLGRKAQTLPGSVSERHAALSVAHLQSSRPNPLSLITWWRALSLSIPVSKASNLGKPAAIGTVASEGHTQALRCWPPSRRGHRISPSLPQARPTTQAPSAPMQASIRLPVPKPIRPGIEGTAPPRLAAVRVQPAAMPVQPQRSALPATRPGIDLSLCSSVAFGLASVDVPGPHSSWTSVLRTGIGTVLPGLEAVQSTPAISWAPYGQQDSQKPVLPATSYSSVLTFPPLRRLSRTITTGVSDASETRVVQLLRLASALGPNAQVDCHHGARQSGPVRGTSSFTGTIGGNAPLVCP